MNKRTNTIVIPPDRGGWAGGLLIVAVSAGATFAAGLYLPARGGPMHDVARSCAWLCLFWTSAGLLAERRARGRADIVRDPGVHHLFLIVALFLGAAAAIIQSVVLTMRAIVVALHLIQIHPWHRLPAFGFHVDGAWTSAMLVVACVLAAQATRDRRLLVTTQLSTVGLCLWLLLLPPVLRSSPTGGFERTGHTALIALALAGLLTLTVIIARAIDRRADAAAPASEDGRRDPRVWPGLSSSVVVIGLVVLFLVCYHLAVPIRSELGGFRATTLASVAAAWIAAAGAWLLVRDRWNAAVADVGMGLASLGMCGMCVLMVPEKPDTLAERYPVVFNALMMGWAGATACWTWLGCDYRYVGPPPAVLTLRTHGPAVARRFAFLTAALALVVSAVMAAWPRLPAIAVTDDSLQRVCAGLAANLFLLWVTLWCGRHMHRVTFQALTVVSVLSAACFLMARMLPFTPRFG